LTKYAIIPDLHVDPNRFEISLNAVDNSHIAFLGNFIDAGEVTFPDNEAVLKTVRSLSEGGGAVAVMGNHELNAVLLHRMADDLEPLRSHSDDHCKQHSSFIDRFGIATPAALEWTDWFMTLPLWLERDDFQLVHACWDEDAIATVAIRRPDGRLQVEGLLEVSEKKTNFVQAVERLASGPEVELPDGISSTIKIKSFAGMFVLPVGRSKKERGARLPWGCQI